MYFFYIVESFVPPRQGFALFYIWRQINTRLSYSVSRRFHLNLQNRDDGNLAKPFLVQKLLQCDILLSPLLQFIIQYDFWNVLFIWKKWKNNNKGTRTYRILLFTFVTMWDDYLYTDKKMLFYFTILFTNSLWCLFKFWKPNVSNTESIVKGRWWYYRMSVEYKMVISLSERPLIHFSKRQRRQVRFFHLSSPCKRIIPSVMINMQLNETKQHFNLN